MLVINKLKTRNFVERVSVDYMYIAQKTTPLVDEHAFISISPGFVVVWLGRLLQ